MKYLILIMMGLTLVGCSTESRLVKVVEYGAGSSIFSSDILVGGCKVVTSDLPIDGSLSLIYSGDKCMVEYLR